jgi:hypothetical protein
VRAVVRQFVYAIILIVGFVTVVVGEAEPAESNPKRSQMKIKIGRSTFTATLEENPTVTALKATLPMTVKMKELNGNEKYFRLRSDLPTNPVNPQAITTGDLMIYGSNTLVLFYKSFATSYSYTRLGRIDDSAGLAAAVGSENVDLRFELAEPHDVRGKAMGP